MVLDIIIFEDETAQVFSFPLHAWDFTLVP